MGALRFDAAIFDLDGVITDTAKVHARAWKSVFDGFLADRTPPASERRTFDGRADYLGYVDGKPREEGVRSFLSSRGIELPEGGRGDPVDADTVHGLARRKDDLYEELLEHQGANVFVGTVRLLEAMHDRGVKLACVSSSKHCPDVLRLAELDQLFDSVVDGRALEGGRLKGKPDPEMFLEAVAQLGCEPARAVVFEDAVSGVEAGRRGGFGLVIGVDRGHNEHALKKIGAHIVVDDLAELTVDEVNDRFSE